MILTAQLNIFKRVSHQDRLLFTKHLATMMKAGIPISEALETLVDQSRNPYFRKVLGLVFEDVKNGKNLATSFEKYPGVFDQFFISLIEIGESSGTLGENLDFSTNC